MESAEADKRSGRENIRLNKPEDPTHASVWEGKGKKTAVLPRGRTFPPSYPLSSTVSRRVMFSLLSTTGAS